ncbi:hypothetical protein FC652_00080 [Vibrio sp. 05-20-BW147]|uniref:hypothetical protein n=1 Tax=Vibrio sp. 05-20-BW147 TaxID=2575834 RepID=UPI001593083B|nr:hypothetical protein [Vibrio sp. 05-20-BW147]NVC61522.1 hypothetical protein [Vibrio sp. 05-20-BW147]
MRANKIVIALSMAGMVSLVGCGSDSADSSAPVAAKPYSVTAIDGYLHNAKVWLDTTPNWVHDEGEPIAYTNQQGIAQLDVSGVANHRNFPVIVQAIAGETIDTEGGNVEPITAGYVMSAPAGEAEVTPLSTLVHIDMVNHLDGETDAQLVAAQQQKSVENIATQLGLTPEQVLGDFLKEKHQRAAFAARSLVTSGVVLAETPEQYQTTMDDPAASQKMAHTTELVNKDIKQTIENTTAEDLADKKPEFNYDADNDGNMDDDGDGVPDLLDEYPDDATEYRDFDGDELGDNADLDDDNDGVNDVDDLFPFDHTQAGDPDQDGYDTILDEFPQDATKAGDHDHDGVDSLVDAYPDNADKSTQDQSTELSYRWPTVTHLGKEAKVLDVTYHTSVETFNSGLVTTEIERTFRTVEGDLLGEEHSIEQTQKDGSFSRISEWRYDFNLDGEILFVGQSLDIGNKTAQGEQYWRYIDEADAALEGTDNGGGRTFDEVNFASRQHPQSLLGIDTIQYLTVTRGADGELDTITTQLDQFTVNGFDVGDDATHVQDYAYRGVEKRREQIPIWLEEHRDWQANGSTNQYRLFVADSENSYRLTEHQPIWSSPTDSSYEEYADYNYNYLKWENRTAYWVERTTELLADSSTKVSGSRYLLADSDAIKRTSAEKPDGEKFSEFSLHERTISSTEKRAYETWHHIALEGYDFTATANVFGHQYTVFNLYDDIWMGYSYTQWFDRDIDLITEVDGLLEQGVPVDQITPEMIPNLNLYAKPAFTPSFRYHDSGEPREWYLVTDDPFYGASGHELQTVTFTPGGLADAYDVFDVVNGIYLLKGKVEQPQQWQDIIPRAIFMLNAQADSSGISFMTERGDEYFASREKAQQRLKVLQAQQSLCVDGDTAWDEQNDRPAGSPTEADFYQVLETCLYLPLTAEQLVKMQWHYYDAEDRVHESYLFLEGGTGVMLENSIYLKDLTWTINDKGIVIIQYPQTDDVDMFALTGEYQTGYYLKGYFQWDEVVAGGESERLSEIAAVEYMKFLPQLELAMSCDTGNTPWDEPNDKPVYYESFEAYQTAVAQCKAQMGDGSVLTAELMAGTDSGRSAYWAVGYYEYIDQQRAFTADEWLYFNPQGTGAFVDAEDGEFPFNWAIENGQLRIDVTHADYVGSYEISELINSDTTDLSLKSFWHSTEWSDVNAGEGEILDQVYRFDGFR